MAQPACETFPTRETCTCHSRSNLDGSKSLRHKDLYRQSLLSSWRIACAQSWHFFKSNCLLWDLKCSNAQSDTMTLSFTTHPAKKKTQDMCFPTECFSKLNYYFVKGFGWYRYHLIPVLFPANAQPPPNKEINKKSSSLESSIPQMGK